MTLQTSGPISMLNIQGEFGGSNPISLSEYYGAAAGIPASGPISISSFYGKTSFPVVTLTPGSISRIGSNALNAVTLTNAVSVGRTGGVAPFVTTAVRLSGSIQIGITVNSVSQVTIASSAGAGVGPITYSAVFRVTVTDSLGNAGFRDITVTHEYSGD